MQNHPYQDKYQIEKKEFCTSVPDKPKMDSDFLREYIRYAREHCKPDITSKNRELIQQFYVKLREESKISGGMNVAVRHIESVIRLSVGTLRLI